jgi:glycosyltransferase involved in cell wall biosynthesis
VKIVSVLTSAADGGAEFAAVAMLEALAARGHDVAMLSNRAGIGRDTHVAVRPVALGPKLSRRTYPGLTAGAPVLLARLRRALEREEPYDALIVHFKKEQLLASLLPRRLRPVLAWAEWGPVPQPLRQGPAGMVYRWAARDVDAVLAVSAATRDSVVAAGVDGRRVHVVHNVVSAEEVRPDPAAGGRLRTELGIAPEAFVIGCVSRWHPDKRNDVAVDAALRLTADGSARPVALVMAGDGEMEAALRARAHELGPAAHFLPTPGPRLTGVLSACDAVVFCPAPTEGAPRAVILTMLCERPCVASGPEGVVDLLPADAIADPEHDPEAVAALLRRYRDDPELVRSEGAAAQRRAAQMHDAERIGAQVERLLRPAG